jgi:hypothetical protein
MQRQVDQADADVALEMRMQMMQEDRESNNSLRPSPLDEASACVCAFKWSPILAILAGFFLLIGATSLGGERLLHVHGLAVASRQTIGAGLGVACRTTLVYGGGQGTLLVSTDGPCNPDPEPDISDVDVCSRIGHPDDIDLGCGSLAVAVTMTALGAVGLLAVALLYVVLAWRTAAWKRDMRDLRDRYSVARASPCLCVTQSPPPKQPLLHPAAPNSCEP